MRWLFLLLLASCAAPDRWNMGVSRGSGDIDGSGWHDYDLEETTLEVGISGPIGRPAAERPPPPCPPSYTPAKTPAPTDDGNLPLQELLYVAIGAGALGGGQMVRKTYRNRRQASS